MFGGGPLGLDSTQVNNLISSALAGQSLSFVASGAWMTVADLHTNFPPGLAYKNKYANVTDLYGSVEDVMRCRFDGVNYRWVPQRESFNGTTASTSGTVNIIPLVTPPTLRAVGGLTGAINFVPSTVNAYRGMKYTVVMEGLLNLNLAQITGLLGSNLSLLGGAAKTIEFNGTNWFSNNN